MPATQEAVSGFWYGWSSGESGMKQKLDENWLRMGVFMNLAVISRSLTTPPASPADGARYIPAAGATGAWAGWEGKVVVYRASLSAWEKYDVKDGTTAVILSEGTWGTQSVCVGGVWSPGAALS